MFSMRILSSAPIYFRLNTHSLKPVAPLICAWPDSRGEARRCFTSCRFPASPPRHFGPVKNCPILNASLLSAHVQSSILSTCASNTRFIHQSPSLRGVDPPSKLPSTPTSSKTPPPLEKSDPDPELQSNSAAVPPNSPTSNRGSNPGGAPLLSISKWPTFDAALTTLIGLCVVFIAGVIYLSWYKARVLDKIEQAFLPGYDPVLELANHSRKDRDGLEHMRRKEQDVVDSIIGGREPGHYFLIMGSKGCGKGSMMIDAMRAIRADGVAFCEAHEDLEVFRLRFGRAINFEYMEDSQTGLFQRRDPREGGPSLDIERALTKLEKVALRMSRRLGRPLVLCINNIHMFDHNEESVRLLTQIQQKAESWAECGILTVVFGTDDFWPYPVLRKNSNRMQILSVSDLSAQESLHALRMLRRSFLQSRLLSPEVEAESPRVLERVLSITGGRLSTLNHVARSNVNEMEQTAERLLQSEKAWLLSQIGLIPDCDDDVMDEQKWSACSWLLLREFVKLQQEAERERDKLITAGARAEDLKDVKLPSIPYWRCRQIMTRTDFLEGLDHANIIAVDVHHDVRLDSAMVLQAAREVVEENGFDEVLDGVRSRIDEIESLHRTRELTFKDVGNEDRIRIEVGKGGRGSWLWK